MEIDGPDPEAYGRVSDPGRYRVVVDATSTMIAELHEAFDVGMHQGNAAVDFPDWPDPDAETVRLVPAEGAPLTFMITDFPGVVVRFGRWATDSFPTCGCDACDEQPVDVVERMRRLVGAAVDGGYREELTKRRLRYSFSGDWGREASESALRRGEWRAHGEPGETRWPPWPRA